MLNGLEVTLEGGIENLTLEDCLSMQKVWIAVNDGRTVTVGIETN